MNVNYNSIVGMGKNIGSGFPLMKAWKEKQWLTPEISERVDLQIVTLSLKLNAGATDQATEQPSDTSTVQATIQANIADNKEDNATTVQATEQPTIQATIQASMAEKEVMAQILFFCSEPHTLKEIMEHLNYTNRPHFLNTYIQPLVGIFLKQTHPESPKHPYQKYVTIKNEEKGGAE